MLLIVDNIPNDVQLRTLALNLNGTRKVNVAEGSVTVISKVLLIDKDDVTKINNIGV